MLFARQNEHNLDWGPIDRDTFEIDPVPDTSQRGRQVFPDIRLDRWFLKL